MALISAYPACLCPFCTRFPKFHALRKHAFIPQRDIPNPEAVQEHKASWSAVLSFAECMTAEVATSAPAMDLTMTMLVAFVRLSLLSCRKAVSMSMPPVCRT